MIITLISILSVIDDISQRKNLGMRYLHYVLASITELLLFDSFVFALFADIMER